MATTLRYSVSTAVLQTLFQLFQMLVYICVLTVNKTILLPTRMWANAQRDGRPAEHRWRPLFNAGKFCRRPLLDAVQ